MLDPFTHKLLTTVARGKKLRRDQYTHLIDAGHLEHVDEDTYQLTAQGTAALNHHH